MTYIAGSMKNLDTNTMQTYIDDALANKEVTIPTGIVFTALVIGVVVVGVGLHRAGILPTHAQRRMVAVGALAAAAVTLAALVAHPPVFGHVHHSHGADSISR